MNDDAAMAPVTGKPIPRVSIGMPVYNGEKFIRDALDSLLAQTFSDFELIISDNASTDDTEAICRDYAAKDARIRYVRQAENLGAAANFKFVLDEAVGEYFMWAAHDDCTEPSTALADLVTALASQYNYAIPNVKLIFEDGRPSVENIMSDLIGRLTAYSQAIGSVRHNNYQVYSLFRLNFLRDNFTYLKNNLLCFGEGVFVHVISISGTGIYVPSAIKVYRRHKENASTVIPAYKLLVDFCKYSFSALKVFLCSSHLSVVERMKIIPFAIVVHVRYMAYLSLAAVKQYLIKIKN